MHRDLLLRGPVHGISVYPIIGRKRGNKMKLSEMTFKSTACRHDEELIKEWDKLHCGSSITEGTLYRVLFTDLPEYLKEQWMNYARDMCGDSETGNPAIELEAIFIPDGDMCNYEFKYYFDEYVTFDVKEEDAHIMCDMFTAFCLEHGDEYPDAYDEPTGRDLGDIEWIELRDIYKPRVMEAKSLPGYTWVHYSDGSGSLQKSDGSCVLEYDLTTHEYKMMIGPHQGWNIIPDGFLFDKFKEFAEEKCKEK